MNPLERHRERLAAIAARGLSVGASAATQAASYVRAEASLLILGPVSRETFETRKIACMSCDHRVESDGDSIGYCGVCGCGSRKRAMLTIKATMPFATCPLKRWPDLVADSDGSKNAHTIYEEGDAGDEHG